MNLSKRFVLMVIFSLFGIISFSCSDNFVDEVSSQKNSLSKKNGSPPCLY